jgi:MarR family transcriptional regulator, lower aerobic nicotinate degradation pathway regulator
VNVNAPRPSRLARKMPIADPPDPSLAMPERMLRQPSAAMFLLMREAFRLGQRRAQQAAGSPVGSMRFPHLAVLACLDEFGSSSQKDVSARLRFDPSDLVTFVDFLEESGYVVRRRDRQDRRRYSLEITAAGRRALRRRDQDAERHNQELFAALSPEEREHLRDLLLRALAHHDPRVQTP